MSDQEHLSAEYMQSKAVGLLSRCGEVAAKLQIMLRMRENMLSSAELLEITGNLVEESIVQVPLTQIKTTFTAKLSEKVGPEVLQDDLEGLAPKSSVPLVEHVLREAEMLYENALLAFQERQRRLYEQALRRAGLIVDQATDEILPERNKSGASAEPTDPPVPSIVDTLSSVEELDDIQRFNIALAHLENLAPSQWKLKQRMENLAKQGTLQEMRLAELSDLVAAERERLKRAQQRRDTLAMKTEELLRSSTETPAQSAQRRLEKLRKELQARKDASSAHQARELLRRMREDLAQAQRLTQQYQEAHQAIKKKMQKYGLDFEQMLLEELQGSVLGDALAASSGDTSLVPSGSTAFQLAGSAAMPAFPVAFSTDGSGRLLAVGRTSSALSMLGLNSSHKRPGTAGLDHLNFSDEQEMLQWCRAQLILLRKRMDSRFRTLTKKLDTWQQERSAGRRRLESMRDELRTQMQAFRDLIQSDSSRVEQFREHIRTQLQSLADAAQRWHEKGLYYERVHRDSLVLLQRMGEEVDSLIQ